MAQDDFVPVVALIAGLVIGGLIVGGAVVWWLTSNERPTGPAATGASLTNHETITYYTLKGQPHTIKVEREVY